MGFTRQEVDDIFKKAVKALETNHESFKYLALNKASLEDQEYIRRLEVDFKRAIQEIYMFRENYLYPEKKE